MLSSECEMAVEKNKLEDPLKQLPDELQNEVLRFAKSLVQKSHAREASGLTESGAPSVRAFFGIWDSGDHHSGDNDRIDADLAREYAT